MFNISAFKNFKGGWSRVQTPGHSPQVTALIPHIKYILNYNVITNTKTGNFRIK